MFTDLHLLSMTTSRALGQDQQPSVRRRPLPAKALKVTPAPTWPKSRTLGASGLDTLNTNIRGVKLACWLPPPRARRMGLLLRAAQLPVLRWKSPGQQKPRQGCFSLG